MAGWGAMMGLGQGLQSFGGMLLDHNKTKMREKLELEREQRAEERAIAREQRQLAQFSGNYEIDRENGLKYKLDKAGNRMPDPMTLTAYEIKQQEMTDRLSELEIQSKEQSVANQGLEGVLKGNQVRDYDADRALRQRREEASIASSLASAEASRSRAMNAGSRGSSDDEASTQAQAAKLLTKEYKDLISSYLGTDESPGPLTVAEVEEIAMEAVRAAALQRKDATVMFRDELAKRAARNKDPEGINFR